MVMIWYDYIACFFAGMFLANVVPHFLFRAGKVSSGDLSAIIVFFAGIAAISTLSSVQFAKKQVK